MLWFLSFSPDAVCCLPGEFWVVPREASSSFKDASEEEVAAVSDVLHQALARLVHK